MKSPPDVAKVNSRRVGMLVHGYYPMDVRVRREAEALSAAGYEVHVVCLRGTKPARSPQSRYETVGEVQVHRLPLTRKRGGSLRYFFEYAALTVMGICKLAVMHRKAPFQVVHIHNMPDALVLAGLIPKWHGARLILDVHDPMAELYRSTHPGHGQWFPRLLSWQEKVSCRLADRVITVSETMRENLEGKGVSPDKLFITHNFPDSRYFPAPRHVDSWPRHENQLCLLYCGTITEHYRLDVAVRAMKSASRELPGLRMRIVGDGNRLEQVRQLVRDLGMEKRVEYIRPVTVDRIPLLMKGADIGISAHQAGVFGDLYFANKILEYLTQGLPVISSRTKTLVRYIPEDCIFYFDPDDAEDMARQIILIQKNPLLVRQKMQNARALLPRYTWDMERERLIEFYRGLLSQSSKCSRAQADEGEPVATASR